jgi:single-stranded DNA-binding protein
MHEYLEVIGHVGKVTAGKGEKPYTRLSVAVSTNYRDKHNEFKEYTNWYTVTIWDKKRADYYKDTVKKGDMVFASGQPAFRVYEKDGKPGIDVAINTEFNGKLRVLHRTGDARAKDGETLDLD